MDPDWTAKAIFASEARTLPVHLHTTLCRRLRSPQRVGPRKGGRTARSKASPFACAPACDARVQAGEAEATAANSRQSEAAAGIAMWKPENMKWNSSVGILTRRRGAAVEETPAALPPRFVSARVCDEADYAKTVSRRWHPQASSRVHSVAAVQSCAARRQPSLLSPRNETRGVDPAARSVDSQRWGQRYSGRAADHGTGARHAARVASPARRHGGGRQPVSSQLLLR